VDARIRELNRREPTGRLAHLARNEANGEARHLSAALREGDAAAGRILHELAEDLAFGLSHVVHLFHPQVIVLGGGLSGVGEPLRAAVARALAGFTMAAFQPGAEIRLPALGEDSVPIGALLLAHAHPGSAMGS
jgi:glucokinase